MPAEAEMPSNKYKYEYKFRAECMTDVYDYMSRYPKRFEMRTLSGYPDCEVIFESELTIEEIREEMEDIEDSHVMIESLNYAEEYTGDRWFNY